MNSRREPQDLDAVVGTGRWTAAARAFESARADRLFNDPWAGQLAGEAGTSALAAAEYNPFLPVRTRYFDDELIRAAQPDWQIVLLGAGMDTRAFRLPLPASCTVFEVDYASAFTEKEAILSTARAQARRTCVHADLSGPWPDALLSEGFDPRTPTVWVAEGLLYYLDAFAVVSLVCVAAALSPDGSAFFADVFGTGLLTTDSTAPIVAARREAGRPLPFCTDSPEELFTTGGWKHATVVHAGQPAANFGRLTPNPETRNASCERNLRAHLVTAIQR